MKRDRSGNNDIACVLLHLGNGCIKLFELNDYLDAILEEECRVSSVDNLLLSMGDWVGRVIYNDPPAIVAWFYKNAVLSVLHLLLQAKLYMKIV